MRHFVRLLSLVALLAALGAAGRADAAKVKVWHRHTPAHYDKAKFHQAVVTSAGTLRLGREIKPLVALEAANVWDLAEDAQGNLYAATGDEGKLYKIAPSRKVSVAFTSGDSQLLSLAQAPGGTLYLGTGPGGKVIRLTPGGNPQVVAEGLGGYVWSLVYDAAARTLYAGTGPKGTIYRIPADGKPAVLYKARQQHVLRLALGAGGTLYAGTDKGGLVYRIDPANGKAFVLFHAHQPEVRALAVTPEAIYVGTSAPIVRKGNSTTSSKTSEERPASPAPGENSLYRIAPDGAARELMRDKTMFLRLLPLKGRLLAATGMQGQLFEIDTATKERSELARLDQGVLHALLQRRDGSIALGTGDPGKLYVLKDRYATSGTVLSEVLDAKLPTRWGALTWKAKTPAGTKVTLAVRGGNVAEPDDTWSAWSAEQTDPLDARALAPIARYLQYRVTLTSESPDTTPEVRNLTLRYQTVNQAPELTAFDVPDLDAGNVETPRKLKLKWTATDPNDDELSYRLYFRRDGWKEWVLMEENLEKKEYDWDTTGVPSGWYRLKLVATDRRDNAAAHALSAERISAPVPVTQIPPTVTLKVTSLKGGRATIEATAADPYVRLTEASFAVDGKRWANVFPTDGLFDGKTEAFRFQTAPLRPGTHVLVLRVRDAAGNTGSGDVVFTVPPRE